MIRFTPVHEDAIIAEDDGQYCRYADRIRALSAAMSEAREVALADVTTKVAAARKAAFTEATAMVRRYAGEHWNFRENARLCQLAARIEAKAGGAT